MSTAEQIIAIDDTLDSVDVALIAAILAGASVTQAAAESGISVTTAYRRYNSREVKARRKPGAGNPRPRDCLPKCKRVSTGLLHCAMMTAYTTQRGSARARRSSRLPFASTKS